MSTTTQELPRERWGAYFDTLSRRMPATDATVEVAGKDLGAQVAATRLVLTGITYDRKDDVVVIGLDAPGGSREELEHLVDHPQRIFVATEGTRTAIDIVDGEDRQTILRMEEAPALPGD
jgi:hypothetical protein